MRKIKAKILLLGLIFALTCSVSFAGNPPNTISKKECYSGKVSNASAINAIITEGLFDATQNELSFTGDDTRQKLFSTAKSNSYDIYAKAMIADPGLVSSLRLCNSSHASNDNISSQLSTVNADPLCVRYGPPELTYIHTYNSLIENYKSCRTSSNLYLSPANLKSATRHKNILCSIAYASKSRRYGPLDNMHNNKEILIEDNNMRPARIQSYSPPPVYNAESQYNDIQTQAAPANDLQAYRKPYLYWQVNA